MSNKENNKFARILNEMAIYKKRGTDVTVFTRNRGYDIDNSKMSLDVDMITKKQLYDYIITSNVISSFNLDEYEARNGFSVEIKDAETGEVLKRFNFVNSDLVVSMESALARKAK